MENDIMEEKEKLSQPMFNPDQNDFYFLNNCTGKRCGVAFSARLGKKSVYIKWLIDENYKKARNKWCNNQNKDE